MTFPYANDPRFQRRPRTVALATEPVPAPTEDLVTADVAAIAPDVTAVVAAPEVPDPAPIWAMAPEAETNDADADADAESPSESRVEVVQVGAIRAHPNPEYTKVAVTTVFGGYDVIVAKNGGVKEGDIAVFVPVDVIVDVTEPCFAFLSRKAGRTEERVRARDIGGLYSLGVLIPLTDAIRDYPELGTAQVGDDVTAKMGVRKYYAPGEGESDATARTPRAPRDPNAPRVSKPALGSMSVYGLESYRRNGGFMRDQLNALSRPSFPSPGLLKVINVGAYLRVLTTFVFLYAWKLLADVGIVKSRAGDVVITEKIDGQNFRAVRQNGEVRVGTHRSWVDTSHIGPKSYHAAAELTYDLEARLPDGVGVYGEVYGAPMGGSAAWDYGAGAKNRPYDSGPFALRMAVFDARNIKTGRFLSPDAMVRAMVKAELPLAPEVYRGPLPDDETLFAMADAPSSVEGATHAREGIIIARRFPASKRDRAAIRKLKLVGKTYGLAKAKGKS